MHNFDTLFRIAHPNHELSLFDLRMFAYEIVAHVRECEACKQELARLNVKYGRTESPDLIEFPTRSGAWAELLEFVSQQEGIAFSFPPELMLHIKDCDHCKNELSCFGCTDAVLTGEEFRTPKVLMIFDTPKSHEKE